MGHGASLISLGAPDGRRLSGVASGRVKERVSESARNRAVARLQRSYACGGMGTDTFERRLDAALTVDTRAALRQTVSDVAPMSLLERVRSRIPPATPTPSSGLLTGIARTRPAILGRSRACDLVLADDSVSRRHAMVVCEGDRIILTDLGSTNGTFVNGRQITQAEVQPGDHLRLGGLDLLL
jgi:predicted component of type VI protein secretion system